MFGLLLISDEPVGLDDIAGALGVSRTGAHVAARELETAGVARRLAVPGSRRILYEANDDMDPIFAGQLSRTRQSLGLVERAGPLVGPGRARARLETMRELHEEWLQGGERILQRWQRRRSATVY